MVPVPDGVDPKDFVINVANGDWALNAAKGWVKRLGLEGTPEGDSLQKRMQISYAVGGTGVSDSVSQAAQREFGVVPAPIPIVTKKKVPKKRVDLIGRGTSIPVSEKPVKKTTSALPPSVLQSLASKQDQDKIFDIFDVAKENFQSPNQVRSNLIIESKNRGVKNPEKVIQNMIDAGLLVKSGNFIRRVPPKNG